ncbi:MAG: peptidoglycan DD-metalloendopeptidase family protein [Planctomycetota bacterium]
MIAVRPIELPGLTVAMLALALALATAGCEAPPVEPPPPVNRADPVAPTPPGGDYDGNVAGRRDASLPPLTRAQYDRFIRAGQALQAGDASACVRLLEPLVTAGRDDEWILNNQGTALLAVGEADRALQVLYRGLDRYPDNGYLHLNAARALDVLDNAGAAIPHYQAWLACDQVDEQPARTLQAMVALGANLASEGRARDAGELLQTARKRFPGSILVEELLAETTWTAGDQELFAVLASDAAQHFDAAQAEAGPSALVGTASGVYQWPLRSPGLIRRGPGEEPGHIGVRWRHAVDLLPLGVPAGGDHLAARPPAVPLLGSDVRDWYGFGTDVLAARDGIVVRAVDHWPDQPRTGVPEVGDATPANRVVLRHADGEMTEYTHLQSGSLQVKRGDRVRAGQVLARVGCSGPRPVVPHLGFRVALDTPDGLCPGLAFTFAGLEQYDEASGGRAGAWSAVAPGKLPANNIPLRRRAE